MICASGIAFTENKMSTFINIQSVYFPEPINPKFRNLTNGNEGQKRLGFIQKTVHLCPHSENENLFCFKVKRIVYFFRAAVGSKQ